jgi:hypothetical protein
VCREDTLVCRLCCKSAPRQPVEVGSFLRRETTHHAHDRLRWIRSCEANTTCHPERSSWLARRAGYEVEGPRVTNRVPNASGHSPQKRVERRAGRPAPHTGSRPTFTFFVKLGAMKSGVTDVKSGRTMHESPPLQNPQKWSSHVCDVGIHFGSGAGPGLPYAQKLGALPFSRSLREGGAFRGRDRKTCGLCISGHAGVRPSQQKLGAGSNLVSMPWGLTRYQQTGDVYFIAFSCYRRVPLLGSGLARDRFVVTLERLRRWYGFYLIGFVVMRACASVAQRTGARQLRQMHRTMPKER